MRHFTGILLIASLFFASCSNPGSSSSSKDKEPKESRTPPDTQSTLTGVYYGNLPCSDCKGILTVLIIGQKGQYSLETVDEGKSNSRNKNQGKYTITDRGSVLELRNSDDSGEISYYKIGINQLTLMSREKSIIKGDHEERYILSKDLSGIKGHEWRLISMKKKPVQGKCHLIFDCFEDKAGGRSFCNNYNGNVNIDSVKNLKFGPLMSTKMACDDLQKEDEYFSILTQCRGYNINGDTLVLLSEKSEEAEFIRAE